MTRPISHAPIAHCWLKGLSAFAFACLAAGCGTASDDSSGGLSGAARHALTDLPKTFSRPPGLGDIERFLGIEKPSGALTPDAAFKELTGIFFNPADSDSDDTLADVPSLALSLVDGGTLGSDVRLALVDGTTLPAMRWKRTGEKARPQASSVSEWRLFHGDVPVEGVQVRSLERSGHSIYAQGNVPTALSDVASTPTRNPLPAEAFVLDSAAARDRIAWRLNFHPWRVGTPEAVYLATKDRLVPAYKAFVNADADAPGRGPDWPLEVLLDARTGDIVSRKVLAFHVDGKARLYEENSVATPTLKEATLPELKETGAALSHPLFSVYSCNSKEPSTACAQNARSTDGDFRAIEPTSKEFDEVVAYHAVSKSMGWYRRLMALKPTPTAAWGPSYPGTRANFGLVDGKLSLNVYVRALTKDTSGTTAYNAAYMPSALREGSMARIVIGTGWEEGMQRADSLGRSIDLQYLGRDADVSMHEFGHHILYRTLRSVGDATSQTAGLHEGMADYFTYAITGNNLLGESIVTSTTSLRAGNKTGRVDPYIGLRAHRSGEFWSSVMWEARLALGPWKDGFYVWDKIVFESIDLYKENAGYYDVISALAKATESFALQEKRPAKDLKEKIFTIFYKRGFIEAPNGSGNLPKATDIVAVALEQGAAGSKDDVAVNVNGGAKKEWYECGVVGGLAGAQKANAPWAFALFAALPLALPLFARARALSLRQRVRIRASRGPRDRRAK